MRPVLAAVLSVVSLTAASAGAQSEPRRTLSPIRMVYTRPPSCPDEQELTDAIAERLHARPFAPSAPSRLLVTLRRTGARYEGTATLHDASDAVVWSVAVPPMSRDCSSVMDSLAFDIAFALAPRGPAAPAAPAPQPPPSHPSLPVAPPAPSAPSPSPSAPASTESPSRTIATRTAIVAYGIAGVALGFGIAWTVDARNKEVSARSLAGQLNRKLGVDACSSPMIAPAERCAQVLSAFQAKDTASGYRNASYAVAGASAAIGLAATIIAVTSPLAIKAPTNSRLTVDPNGISFRGSF